MEYEDKHYYNILRNIFPYTNTDTIQEIINLIMEQYPSGSNENRLENMIDLLIGDGNSITDNYFSVIGQFPSTSNDVFSDKLSMVKNEIESSFSSLSEIFPDICPIFLKTFLKERNDFVNVAEALEYIADIDYPRKSDTKKTLIILKEMLPNADPSYLEANANNLAFQPEEELKKFVNNAVENKNYPTLEEYKKRQEKKDKKERYTKKFNPKVFLEEFPNPDGYFGNPDRKNPLTITSMEDNGNEDEKIAKQEMEEKYAITFLLNHYTFLRESDIMRTFKYYNKSLYKTCQILDRFPIELKMPRKETVELDEPDNMELLQEIAFLKNKILLKALIKQKDLKYQQSKLEAIRENLLQTCSCCFDDELIPEECYFCNDGCIFCKDCVKKGVETLIGEGKLEFPCLSNCGSEFGLLTLKMILNENVLEKMLQRKQIQEIKQANIPGLETCPFCDFAMIPPENDKIFRCQASDCMKESCRECRHESHIPIPCNEMEYDEDVKIRTYIENKMTEALVRQCWKCNTKFIKESGCNKMTCSCGAKMCYVCKQPVKDYSHFSSSKGRCPLRTEDLKTFHENIVRQGGLQAKTELGVDKAPNKLKNDPMKPT